jgi:uncharacterized integral membrane protein
MAIKRDLFLAILMAAIAGIAAVIISIIKTQWKLVQDPIPNVIVYALLIVFFGVIIYLAVKGMRIIESKADTEKLTGEAKLNAIIDYLHIPPELIAEKEKELMTKQVKNTPKQSNTSQKK